MIASLCSLERVVRPWTRLADEVDDGLRTCERDKMGHITALEKKTMERHKNEHHSARVPKTDWPPHCAQLMLMGSMAKNQYCDSDY